MAKNIIGKPYALKQVNLSRVRKVIKENGSATRAEIVNATKISVTTVRTLLTEMLENNEIAEAGQDESIGGRRAVRYVLKKDRFYGAAFCLDFDNRSVHYLIVDIYGNIRETGILPDNQDAVAAICSFLDDRFARMEIRSIGIGVSGIVNGMEYLTMNEKGELETFQIGEKIRKRYQVPVLLENDLNAITLGFGRCYLKRFPDVKCENINMAYLYFDKTCLSAGFLSDGRILRGSNHFAGELGLFTVNDTKRLDEILALPLTDEQYARLVAKIIEAVCCFLNPQYIAVGGESFREESIALICEYFDGMLPAKMSAEILYAADKWEDYYEGMAYLTAGQIFADVQLIKGGL